MTEKVRLVYIAVPYTTDAEWTRIHRCMVADRVAAHYANEGYIVYSPISSWHHIAKRFDLPITADYWEKQNTWYLSQASVIAVLMIDGWLESTGVAQEIALAADLGIARRDWSNVDIADLPTGDFTHG